MPSIKDWLHEADDPPISRNFAHAGEKVSRAPRCRGFGVPGPPKRIYTKPTGRPPKKAPKAEARIRVAAPGDPKQRNGTYRSLRINYDALAKVAGVSRATVRRWFVPKPHKDRKDPMDYVRAFPTLPQAYKLAQYLGITMEQLAWSLGTAYKIRPTRPVYLEKPTIAIDFRVEAGPMDSAPQELEQVVGELGQDSDYQMGSHHSTEQPYSRP